MPTQVYFYWHILSSTLRLSADRRYTTIGSCCLVGQSAVHSMQSYTGGRASCYLEMPGQEAMSWLSVTTFSFQSDNISINYRCLHFSIIEERDKHNGVNKSSICITKAACLLFPIFFFLANSWWKFLGCPGEERRGLIAGVSIREVWPHFVPRSTMDFSFE